MDDMLILAVLEINSGSDQSWWSQNLGSVILAWAALLAAAVTIYDRRLAFANDRHLTRLEHTRDRIDSALASMTKAQTDVGNFLANVQAFEGFRDEQRGLAERAGTEAEFDKLKARETEVRERLEKERETTRPVVQALAVSGVQLSVRLGLDHDIYLNHEAARETAFTLFSALADGVLDNRSREARDNDEELNEARHEADRTFRTACRTWFTTESPIDRPARAKTLIFSRRR